MIRKAKPSDINSLSQLAVKMWTSHTESDLRSEFEKLLVNEDSAIFIYSEDGKAVGFAQCQLRHDYVEGTLCSPVGYLEGVFVEKEYRNRGYGRMLVNACEQWAKDKGCSEFASDCKLENQHSLHFHLRTGFKEVNRVICFVKPI